MKLRMRQAQIPKHLRKYFRPIGYKPKDLVNVPHLVSEALREDGWWLRSGLPWVKRSAMPESVSDRPASALEYVYLLSKSQKYYFDMDAIKLQSSPDSHRRYARGRSDNHKLVNGGPGNQTIAKSMDHMIKVPDNYKGSVPGRKDGPGQERRSKKDRIPGVTPKSAPAGSGIKANESFHEAVGDLVGSRNFRNTDLFFQSLEPPFGMIFCGDEPVGLDVNPRGFKEAHFATFCEQLIEPLILSSTSEKGCCPECGSPWVRVVEKKLIPQYESRHGGYNAIGNKNGMVDLSQSWTPGTNETKTIGWGPGCSCTEQEKYTDGSYSRSESALPPVPCTVLDIFGGSGTVGIVAHKYGRNFTLIELNPEYAEMAKKRLEQATRQKQLPFG